MGEKTYYNILHIDKDASAEDIKKAYRKLVKRYHPDVNRTEDGMEMFKSIQSAYETLSNTRSRLSYDDSLEEAITVEVSDVSSFYPVREDLEVRCNITLTLEEAVDGGIYNVDLPNGSSVKIKIPNNSYDGMLLRFKGYGNVDNNDKGDLYIEIVVDKKSSIFLDDELDIMHEIVLSKKEAIYGGEFQIPITKRYIDSKEKKDCNVLIDVPKNAYDGMVLKYKDEGNIDNNDNIKGDLYIKIDIKENNGLFVFFCILILLSIIFYIAKLNNFF